MDNGYVLLVLLLSPWILWGLYILVMGVYRAHLQDRLTTVSKVLSAPYIVAAYFLDVFVNVLATFVFAEVPKEKLLTTRLKRYLAGGDGFRKSIASWVCVNLLDVFDPSGNHCD